MHSNVLTKINSSRVARDASRRHREGGNPWTLHFLIVAKINSFRAARDARSRCRESENPCTLHVLIVASINSFRAARDTSRHSRAGGNSWTLHVLIVAKINSFRAARDFISFDKRQNKRSKEKTLSRRSSLASVIRVDIFRLAVVARSKNGTHPCAPPSGCPIRTRIDWCGRPKASAVANGEETLLSITWLCGGGGCGC